MAQVFPYLGWQVFDENGNPAAGAKAYFYAAGTSTPVDVYSNSTLATAYTQPVVADSEGRFPTIYAASGVYKVKVTDSANVDLFPEIDQLTVLTDLTAIQLSFPTVTKTANYTIVASDRGKVLEFDAAGSTLIVTAKAAVLGSGFPVWIVNSGATGTVQLSFDPGETLLGATTYNITVQHQSIGITSRGAAGWRLFTATGNLVLLDAANIFTADQTITSTDAGALVGPLLRLFRNSISPAAADTIASLLYEGKNSASVRKTYAQLYAKILDETSGSEDGSLALLSLVAGVATDQLVASDGVVFGAATGGAKGTGTANATEYFKNGSPLGGMTLLATIATTSGTTGSATGLNPSLYRKYYIEIDGISLTASANPIQISLSGDGGTNYGTALTISANSGGAVNTFDGWLELGNINSTRRFGCTIGAGQVIDQTGATANVGPVLGGHALGKAATGAGNPVDAIRISTTGTFDAGAFRVYGER